MAQMPVVEEGAEPPPYFPRTLVTQSVGTIIVFLQEDLCIRMSAASGFNASHGSVFAARLMPPMQSC